LCSRFSFDVLIAKKRRKILYIVLISRLDAFCNSVAATNNTYVIAIIANKKEPLAIEGQALAKQRVHSASCVAAIKTGVGFKSATDTLVEIFKEASLPVTLPQLCANSPAKIFI
jgi:hypothetical protein